MLTSEQQREELRRALNSPDPTESLRALDRQGILTRILPELEPARGSVQPPEHFWDVFGHLLEAVNAIDAVLADPILLSTKFPIASYLREQPCGYNSRLEILKITALLHDIAKPQTRTKEANGKYRFFGHPEQGAEIADRILRRLQFPDCEVKMVETMIIHHLRPGVLAYKETPTDRALLRYFRDLDGVAVDTLILNLADHRAMRGPLMGEEEWIEHLDAVKSILDRYFEYSLRKKPPKLITGDDLMRELGLGPGPMVGDLLETIKQSQIRGIVRTREEALTLARKTLSQA